MTTIFLTILLCFNLYAPGNSSMVIVESKPIRPYEGLIYAIGKVECNLDTLAYNPIEMATGYYQIRPIRIVDYNKRTGSHYTLNDMYDYYDAEKVFLYYASRIGPYDFERIAKSWNGAGSMTIEYWEKVKKVLLSL